MSNLFRAIPNHLECTSPDHEIPMFISIPVGTEYFQKCSGCGKETRFGGSSVMMLTVSSMRDYDQP